MTSLSRAGAVGLGNGEHARPADDAARLERFRRAEESVREIEARVEQRRAAKQVAAQGRRRMTLDDIQAIVKGLAPPIQDLVDARIAASVETLADQIVTLQKRVAELEGSAGEAAHRGAPLRVVEGRPRVRVPAGQRVASR